MTARNQSQAEKSPFWKFSVKFYAVPGVAPACIALQDLAGVDVNLLFFLLWNASQGRALNKSEIKELDHMVGVWRNTAVIPLRQIRRALKSPQEILAPDLVKDFRSRVMAAELEAERLQQEAMYALAGRFGIPMHPPAAAAHASIAAYQSILSPLPPDALEVVLAAFARTSDNG
jgi:uncharacterized protein (TIGR02444 family)